MKTVHRTTLSGRGYLHIALAVAIVAAVAGAAIVSRQASAATISITSQVAVASDDARSPDTGGFTSSELSALVGSGNGKKTNVAGYRFTNLQIPNGAIIDSATLTLMKNGTEWHGFVVTLAFEASNSAATFTSASPPSSRTRTAAASVVNNNRQWTNGVAYPIGDSIQLAASLQEVVNRPGWQAGASFALIAFEPASPAWGRLAFYTYGGGSARTPKLTVSYHVSGGAATPTSTPTTAPNTPTASSTPTSTLTPTIAPTPTNTPTATTGSSHSILVGPGFSDVSPHQAIRTSAGVVYAIVPTCSSYPSCPGGQLVAYRGNQAGAPSGFTAMGVPHQPTGGIGSSAIAVDGEDRIHVVWIDHSGAVRYATFDTASDSWSTSTILDQSGWTTFGQGDEGVGLALDANGAPHAVWNFQDGSGRLHVRYANRAGGVWSPQQTIDDVSLAPNHSVWHPTIAFAPNGALWFAWLDGSFNYTPDGVIRVRVRDASGSWGTSTTVADTTMTAIDNGPSLLITPDGVVHLTFVNTVNVIRYWYDAGAGWRGDQQPPSQVTHDPSLGPDGHGGVFIYGHGTPAGDIGGHGDDLYRFGKPQGGVWGAWSPYASGAFDSSVGTRWAQFFQSDPETLDIIYWSDAYPNMLYLGTESTSAPIPPTPTSTPMPTQTPTPTNTPVPTLPPTPTDTIVPTFTSSPTNTPVPTATQTSTQTSAPTPTPTATQTAVTGSATLVGTQQVEPMVDYNPAGVAEAFQYTAGGSGVLSSLSIYIDSSSTANTIAVGIYSDNGADAPGTLLGHATITAPIAGAWNTAAISPASVTAGAKYWIAVLAPVNGGTVRFRDVPSGGRAQTSLQTTLGALPSTWSPGVNYSNAPMSAYGSGS